MDIPTIDISSLLMRSEEDEKGKKKAVKQIGEACVNYGFFQIVNHGIPLDLLRRTMDVYKNFFACSDEDKLSVPYGYLKSTQHSAGVFEHLLFHLPSSAGCPNNPPHLKQVLEGWLPISQN